MAHRSSSNCERSAGAFRAWLRPRTRSKQGFPAYSADLAEQVSDSHWQLRETQVRYRDLLDSQDDLILRCDEQGRITFANRAVCSAFALSPSSVIGSAFLPRRLSGHRPPPLNPTSDHRRQTFTLELETSAGPRWFDFEEQIVVASGDDTFETQLVGHDVTERRLQEIDLAEARDAAEAANRAKSRFLAAMSHEIRTPMNGILGVGSLLKETELTADQRTFVQAIDRSARTLLALIDEILDFSKIEAGKLDLHERTFNIEDCVQSVVELLAPRAAEAGIELAWAIDPVLPELVIGDEGRVRQILTNLVGNAVKFTEKGGVLVTVGRGPDVEPPVPAHFALRPPTNMLRLAISVADTGVGIKPETFSTLFAEFEQGDPSVHRQHGGTGLGLAISRRLARAMDGDITVTSEPGRGSCFTTVLALQRVRTSRALRLPDTDTDGAHVLLLGLRPMTAKALRLTFEGVHVPVETAPVERAATALEAAARVDAPFTVVIFDGTATVETMAAILAKARRLAQVADVRGIVCFGANQRAAYPPFEAVGASGYLLHPVRPSSLLAQCLGRSWRRTHFAAIAPDTALRSGVEPVTGSRHRLRVLLAEDNAINALVARRMLEGSACDVIHVLNGREAVAAVVHARETGLPGFDLVLMDVHMPVMDGLEATVEIRKIFASAASDARCPSIVALTANAFSEDRQRCLDAGMDDYLAKPFERADFNALLDRLRNTKM